MCLCKCSVLEEKARSIENKEGKMKEKIKPNRLNKILWLILGLAVISLVVVIAGNSIKVPYTVTESYYEDQQVSNVVKFYVDENYPEEECKQVDLAYRTKWGVQEDRCTSYDCASYSKVCVSYGTRDGSCKKWNWLGTVCAEYYQVQGDCIRYEEVCNSNKCTSWYHTCKLEITNLDTERGMFTVSGTVLDSNQKVLITQTPAVNIDRYDTETLSWGHSRTSGSVYCSYKNIGVPRKTVCEVVVKTRKVQREKTVTSTERVLKTRDVIQYRTLFKSWGI